MALNPRTRGPRRTLAALLVAMIVLFGGIAAAATWASAQWTPKLGLDLEGGTEMTLEPVLADPTQQVNQGQLDKARDIISQRVDSYGVAEAEVTTQGGRNIVVSIPGTPDAATLDAIRKPSQLRFRAVLAADAGSPQAAATGTATATDTHGYRDAELHGHDAAARVHAGPPRHQRGHVREPGHPASPDGRPDAGTDRPAPTAHGDADGHADRRERHRLDHSRDPRPVHQARLLQARVGQRRRRRPDQAARHVLRGQGRQVHPRPGRGRRHRHRRRVGRLPDLPERPADQRRRGQAHVQR